MIVSQVPKYWASAMEIRLAAGKQGAVSGHGGEAQLMPHLLALSIAAYDEYPDMYQMIAGAAFVGILNRVTSTISPIPAGIRARHITRIELKRGCG